MIKDLRRFVEYMADKKHNYMEGSRNNGKFGFVNVETMSFPINYELLDKFKADERFDLSEDEISYLDDLIPDSFSDYIHYRGHFFFINYGTGTASPVEKSQIDEKVKIFDFSHCDLKNLLSNVRAGLNLIENALENYDANNVYDEFNYTIEKERMTPNETYDASLSVTREQSDAMYKWRAEHNKKCHKKGFGYRGTSPTSNFEIRFGSCSIGNWADCVCTSCLEAADNAEEVGDTKAAEKIRKRAKFEVFNNM